VKKWGGHTARDWSRLGKKIGKRIGKRLEGFFSLSPPCLRKGKARRKEYRTHVKVAAVTRSGRRRRAKLKWLPRKFF
jgi:hypothetical protein